MNTKEKLIARAAASAAHIRTPKVKRTEITSESISFKVGDSKTLLETFKPNSRSAAMRAALKYADENGELDEFKNE